LQYLWEFQGEIEQDLADTGKGEGYCYLEYLLRVYPKSHHLVATLNAKAPPLSSKSTFLSLSMEPLTQYREFYCCVNGNV